MHIVLSFTNDVKQQKFFTGEKLSGLSRVIPLHR